jgi:predicted nucleotidyltransferase component of viral defense system
MQKNIADLKELSVLPSKTANILMKLSDLEIINNHVLIGGTALAIHLNHRLSEDLDFFSHTDFDFEDFFSEMKRNFNNVSKRLETKKQVDFIIEGIKVTFRHTEWDLLPNSTILYKNLRLGTLKILIAMKVITLFSRAKFRDYYDLYTISKELCHLDEIYSIAAKFVSGVNPKLLQMALSFTADIEEESISHLKPKYNVTKDDISEHFIKEIKKWNKKIADEMA